MSFFCSRGLPVGHSSGPDHCVLGGVGLGGQGGCEQRSEVFVKIQKKKFLRGGGLLGSGAESPYGEELTKGESSRDLMMNIDRYETGMTFVGQQSRVRIFCNYTLFSAVEVF